MSEDSKYRSVYKEMSRNVHSKEDIMYLMRPTRNFMLAFGVWPSRSGFRKVYNFLVNFIFNFIIICEIIPGCIYWLLEESLRIRLELGPVLFYDFLCTAQYDIIISRKNNIMQCWKHVKEDWENTFSADDRNVLIKRAKSARILTFICAALMYIGEMTYRTILPLSQGVFTADQNDTIRILSCPVNFLFIDVYVSPFYEIVFVLQTLTGMITVSITMIAYSLLAYFIQHASGQLKILIRLMKGLVQEQWQKDEEIDRKLAEVVEHQIRVHNFLQSVQYIMQEICLGEIIAYTLSVCLLLYFAVMDWDTGNFGIIGSYALNVIDLTIHIFLFCYVGEQLNDQAEKVAIESRELEWYNLPEKKMRSVVLLMIMSNYPPKIYAGKIMELSLKTFGDIIKTTGAYFNMIRSVTE